jgi:hypothetical protein
MSQQFDVPEPSYEWVDKHNDRADNLQRAHGRAGGLWGIVLLAHPQRMLYQRLILCQTMIVSMTIKTSQKAIP